jgi:hypothetical protein
MLVSFGNSDLEGSKINGGWWVRMNEKNLRLI